MEDFKQFSIVGICKMTYLNAWTEKCHHTQTKIIQTSKQSMTPPIHVWLSHWCMSELDETFKKTEKT